MWRLISQDLYNLSGPLWGAVSMTGLSVSTAEVSDSVTGPDAPALDKRASLDHNDSTDTGLPQTQAARVFIFAEKVRACTFWIVFFFNFSPTPWY